jgi:hypothetical protein
MEKCKEYNNLEELKNQYEKLKIQYKLPDFSELNELFDIEEIDVETDFLLRRIRRTISERIASYLRFIELILNPSSAPMFFFKLVKKLDNSDKEILTKVYEIFGSFEVELIALDLNYSEKDEADFIKKSYRLFTEELKDKFLKIIEKLNNGDDNKKRDSNGSYFG